MFTRNLSTSCEVLPCVGLNNQAINTASNTVTVTTAIDTAGYQSVMFILESPADIAANTPILSATGGANTTVGGFTAIANSTVPVGANTTIQVLELARPSTRYVAPSVLCGAKNTTVTCVAVLIGREPQELGGGNPQDNMVAQNSTFNTTTGVFGGVANTKSATNTPTSKLLLANP